MDGPAGKNPFAVSYLRCLAPELNQQVPSLYLACFPLKKKKNPQQMVGGIICSVCPDSE